MDLEMTGLDPGRHVIVEIATLITDDDLELVAEGPDLVVHAGPEQLAEMDDVVVTMHTRSGLLPEIQSSTITLEEAGAATLAFLKEHIPDARSVPLCGNSIGTDRRFLAAYLPDIENYLHYRSVDVSSVKELVRRWYPSVRAQRPRKAGSHRALDDIRESVAELRYYRERVFVPPAVQVVPAVDPTAPTTNGPSAASAAGPPDAAPLTVVAGSPPADPSTTPAAGER
jgi:oligoribonuclease